MLKDVQIKDYLSYKEVPTSIIDRHICKMQTMEVASIKILWRNQNVEEMTWEVEFELFNL